MHVVVSLEAVSELDCMHLSFVVSAGDVLLTIMRISMPFQNRYTIKQPVKWLIRSLINTLNSRALLSNFHLMLINSRLMVHDS